MQTLFLCAVDPHPSKNVIISSLGKARTTPKISLKSAYNFLLILNTDKHTDKSLSIYLGVLRCF